MGMTEVIERRQVDWEIIKVLRLKPIGNMTSAIQIRKGITDSGNVTFSYAFGVYVKNETMDEGEHWVTYKYIPDRYARDYLQLFEQAVSRVKEAIRESKNDCDDDGNTTPSILNESVVRYIQRHR